MSILDAFYFSLRADTSDAERGIRRTGTEFDNLTDDVRGGSRDISRDFDDMADNVGASLTDMIKGFGALAAGALGVGMSIEAIGEHLNSVVQKAGDAASLGVPIEQYDALGQAMQNAGLEADEYRDLMVDLNEVIGNATLDATGTEAETLGKLGIGLKDASGNAKNAASIFEDLAAAAEKLDPARFTALARQMGVSDPKTIQLLAQGSAHLKEQIALAKQRGVMDEGQQKAAIALGQAQRELSATFSHLLDQVAMGLIPALNGLLKGISAIISFVQEHKELLTAFFGVVAVGAVWMLQKQILGLLPVMRKLAVSTLAATWPWVLLALAAGAVALIIEDLWKYFTDPTAKTVTGDLANRYEWVRDALNGCRDAVVYVWQAMQRFGKDATEIWQKIIDSINSLNDGKAVAAFVDGAKQKFNELYTWLKDWGSKLGDYLYNVFAGVVNGAITTLNKIPGVSFEMMPERTASSAPDQASVHTAGVPVHPLIEKGQGIMAEANSTPLNSVSNNAVALNNIQGNRTVHAPVQIDRVEVNTQASDPQAVSAAISTGLGDQVKNVVQQWDDGVSH